MHDFYKSLIDGRCRPRLQCFVDYFTTRWNSLWKSRLFIVWSEVRTRFFHVYKYSFMLLKLSKSLEWRARLLQVAHRWTLLPSASMLCRLFHNGMKFFMKKQIVYCLIWRSDSFFSCVSICIYALKTLQVFKTTCKTFTSRSSTDTVALGFNALWTISQWDEILCKKADCLLFDLRFGLVFISCLPICFYAPKAGPYISIYSGEIERE